MIRFSKYLEENKVEDKGDHIVKDINALDKRIEEKKEELEKVKQLCESKEKEANQMQVYEDILNHIIKKNENSDEYKEISDIINFKVNETKQRLAGKVEELNQKIDQQNPSGFIKEMTDKKIVLHNRIATKQKQLEELEELKSRYQTHSDEVNFGGGNYLWYIKNMYAKSSSFMNNLISMDRSKQDIKFTPQNEEYNIPEVKEEFVKTLQQLQNHMEDFDKLIADYNNKSGYRGQY